jgi:hypothetical protein
MAATFKTPSPRIVPILQSQTNSEGSTIGLGFRDEGLGFQILGLETDRAERKASTKHSATQGPQRIFIPSPKASIPKQLQEESLSKP